MDGRPRDLFFYRRSLEYDRGDGETGSESNELSAFSGWFESLTGEEALCWAFDISPSDLSKVYWKNTDDDLQNRLKLKYGFEHAKVYQAFETLSVVASYALGGKKPKSSVKPAETFEEAEMQFNNIFG